MRPSRGECRRSRRSLAIDSFAPEVAHRVPLWETIATALRRAIMLGELAPGVHLEEPALAQKFDVSRIPIREALVRLDHEGLVRVEPRRGAFVVGVSDDDISNIYACRRLLELHAVRRAAEFVDATGVEQLVNLTHRMEDALEYGRLDLIAQPDVDFHRQLVALARNRFLLAGWEPIAGLVHTILSVTDTTHRDMPRAVASHLSIARALEAHDADEAVALLQEHLEHGESVMRLAMHLAAQAAGK